MQQDDLNISYFRQWGRIVPKIIPSHHSRGESNDYKFYISEVKIFLKNYLIIKITKYILLYAELYNCNPLSGKYLRIFSITMSK